MSSLTPKDELSLVTMSAAADAHPAVVGDNTEDEGLSASVISLDAATPRGIPGVVYDSMSVQGEEFIEPPDDPAAMYALYRLSPYLRPIVDAFSVNVYEAPYVLKPVIPFDRPQAAEQSIRRALIWRSAVQKLEAQTRVYAIQLATWEATKAPVAALPVPPPRLSEIEPDNPTDAEVSSALQKLRERSELEWVIAQSRLGSLSSGKSWRELWKLTGQDLEAGGGTAYWEILRDIQGEPVRVQRLSPLNIRVRKPSRKLVKSATWRAQPDFTWKKEIEERSFFTWAQLSGEAGGDGGAVLSWFKEFGDPRVLSQRTGQYYANVDAFYAAEWVVRTDPRPRAATEILVIRSTYGGSSAYGMTASAGIYPDLIGSRDLAEENQRIVADEGIPNIMLLIGGGLIGKRTRKSIESSLQERKKGRKAIIVVEANTPKAPIPGGPAIQPTIAIERLKDQQNNDSTFTKYDERVEEKADAAHRMPRVSLGKDKGANRAVADVMHRFTQDEVYAPRRVCKDDVINDNFFPAWGITLWKFMTPSTKPRDPLVVAEVLKSLVASSIVTPNEAREEAGTIFNRHFEDLRGLWTQLPPAIMTTLLQTKNKELAAILLGNDQQAIDKLSELTRKTMLDGGDSKATDIPGPTK